MTIENASIIDGIGLDKVTGDLVLFITDRLTWEYPSYHVECLQNKLSAYMNYLGSGQYLEQLPDASGRARIIDLVYEHTPNDYGLEVYETAKIRLQELGVGFMFHDLSTA